MRTRASRLSWIGFFLVGLVGVSLGGCGAKSGLLSVEASDAQTDTGTTVLPDTGPDSLLPDVIVETAPDGGFGCPIDPPTTTAACTAAGAVCTYRRGKVGPCSDATASDEVVYRCERDGWLEIARCIDPTACPPSPPVEGSPCSNDGLDCFYASPVCAASSIAQCETGVWHGVDDCGARPSETDCVLTATLSGETRVMLDGKGTIADRPALAAAGTQLFASWALTPELGGTETIDFKVMQTAVPSMARPLPFDFTGAYDGDTMPAADFARDRFALAWGSTESTSAGGWSAMAVLDGDASSHLVSPKGRAARSTSRARRAPARRSVGSHIAIHSVISRVEWEPRRSPSPPTAPRAATKCSSPTSAPPAPTSSRCTTRGPPSRVGATGSRSSRPSARRAISSTTPGSISG
jgi:hypothetical protein